MRAARPQDLPELQRIEVDGDQRFVEAGRPELASGDGIPQDVAERASAQGRLLVAEWVTPADPEGASSPEVVGWVYVGRLDGELCVGQVSVLRRYGQRGVGTALLRAVVDAAREAGEPSVVLNTEAHLPWSRPWYERLGFVVVPPEAWSPAMARVFEEQRAGGLDPATRVHMRLML